MIALPRRFRPHCIKLLLKLHDDENGNSQERVIYIDHVKVDMSYGIQQSKKGITTEDKIAVYIELFDCTAFDEHDVIQEYLSKFEYDKLVDKNDYFTILAGQDTFEFHGELFLINTLSEIVFTSDKPIRLELLAK